MPSYSMLCCSWSKQAGRSKVAKAVLKLVEASLCSSWSLPNPPGYPQNPADQCVHSPVVAREDVSSVLVGENLLSLNRMALLLHPLPRRASGASVGTHVSATNVASRVGDKELSNPLVEQTGTGRNCLPICQAQVEKGFPSLISSRPLCASSQSCMHATLCAGCASIGSSAF